MWRSKDPFVVSTSNHERKSSKVRVLRHAQGERLINESCGRQSYEASDER